MSLRYCLCLDCTFFSYIQLYFVQAIKELMKRTFSIRKQEILNGTITLDQYTPLKNYEEVKCIIVLTFIFTFFLLTVYTGV